MRCPQLEELPPPPHNKTRWPWTEASPQLPHAMPDGSPWPKVSIVTPSFNQVAFIEETIRSVLLQGYPNLEYIIVDGGSIDGSTEIIKEYEPWLAYWVSEPDQGQSCAINKGFDKSTGEIIAWLNSDDIYFPNAIACVVRHLTDHPEAAMLYGEAWYINTSSDSLQPCRPVPQPIGRNYILNRDPIVQPSAFWRKGLYTTIGKLDSNLTWGFDWEFFIRAYLNAELYYIPQLLAKMRLHDDMKTRTGGEARHAELARITRRYGGWWQPTNLVYQATRPRYFVAKLTSGWPRWIKRPLEVVSGAPLLVVSCLTKEG